MVASPLLQSAYTFRAFPAFSPSKRFLCFYSTITISSLPRGYERIGCDLYQVTFSFRGRHLKRIISALCGTHVRKRDISFPHLSPSKHFLTFALRSFNGFSV